MSEFRHNLITNEWVVVATERAKRPHDFIGKKASSPLPEYSETCPFCPGNEKNTPVAVYRYPVEGDWKIRVIPNKYAALKPTDSLERQQVGRYLKFGGFGYAEVVVETPKHNQTLGTLSVDEAYQVMLAYKARYDILSADERIDLVTIFRNHGERAGTSLEHPHSQIIATPLVPLRVRNQLEETQRYSANFGTCVFCDILKEEKKDGRRIVLETEHFVAFEPFASRSPFETWIFPKRHQSVFGAIHLNELHDMAKIVRDVLYKIHTGLENPDYNLILQSAPTKEDDVDYYHWYIRIIPRLSTPAGFEMGTGIYISTAYPEETAEFLRKVDVPL